ncbi:MAG: ABC transporter permease [Candidatus Riflebacteria bacterium HGW-Riflebacteria-1]|jgi:iron complex transport system permease protein|nr:MAG: ABC transporter permease [Candidatus Riflebacteria bacterium HGW-Riflebacteria-1]
MTHNKFRFTIIALMALLAVTAYLSLHIGSIKIPWSAAFVGFDATRLSVSTETALTFKTVITEIRLPRILAAVFCGAALAVSGAAYQSMFMNPLVSPALLGVLAGAAFGASLGMLLSKSMLVAQLSAFIFGGVAVGLAVFLTKFFPGNRLIMLIMGGVISSSLFTSLLSVIKFVADAQNELPAIVYWLMGGFSAVSSSAAYLVLPFIAVGMILIIAMSGYMNVLSMGDEEATSLGVDVKRIRTVLIIITTLISSLTVALGGMIGWVGLMIPHIARMICGPDNRRLLPMSALIGAIYLLIVDNICRAAFSGEIPIGIMTSLMGVPFFILVLSRTESRWN